QFGGNGQQLLAARKPVLGWHLYSLSSLPAPGRKPGQSNLPINWLDSLRPVPPVAPLPMGLDFPPKQSRVERGGRWIRVRITTEATKSSSSSSTSPGAFAVCRTETATRRPPTRPSKAFYKAFSSSATAVTDFFASPNSIVVPSP